MKDRIGSEFVAAGDLIDIQVQLPNDVELLLSRLRSLKILAICTILLLFCHQPPSNQLLEPIVTKKSESSFETNCNLYKRERVSKDALGNFRLAKLRFVIIIMSHIASGSK